jgi:hypothetical protein
MFGRDENVAQTSAALACSEPQLGVYRIATANDTHSFHRKRHGADRSSPARLQRSAKSSPQTACAGVPVPAFDAADPSSHQNLVPAQQSDGAINEIIAWLRELGKLSG